MKIREWKGYQEGRDISKIAADFLTYPTKNVLIYKNKAYKRPGITIFGATYTTENKILGEYVWKDAGAGEIGIRAHGQKVDAWLEPYKDGAGWVEIFAALDSSAERVRFATWIDSNDSIIHKRCFFVDGSSDVYQWNGAVGVVASVAGDVITLVAGKSAEALGFDDGSGTPQTVIINGTEYTYNNDPTAQDLNLTSTPTGVAAGDLVIAKPNVSTTTLSTFNKDHIYTFKNHVMLAALDSVQCYFSHISSYPLDYTVPAPASRTAATPFFINLDGNVTASIERNNRLWLSTQDDWFKIEKLDAANAFDLYVEVEKDDTTERNGALPFAVTTYKGDTIFVAQDKTIQMITDLELIQSDTLKLISDEIVGMLQRIDMTEVRVRVHDRYIYIICPAEPVTLMYDTIDGFWQPPQVIAMGHLSVIGGNLIGHSNARNESFTLFSGRQDLGVDFEAVFALPYIDHEDEFVYNQFTKSGISGRCTESAHVEWTNYYFTDETEHVVTREIDGADMKLVSNPDDASWGSLPFMQVPYGGSIDEAGADVRRFNLFDAKASPAYFEYRPIITVTGESAEFHLLSYFVDQKVASRKVGNDLYLSS